MNLRIARQADRDFNGRIDVGKGAMGGQANGMIDRRFGQSIPVNGRVPAFIQDRGVDHRGALSGPS